MVLNMHPKKKLAHLDSSGIGASKMMNGGTSHCDMDDQHTSATSVPKYPPSGFYNNQPYLSLKSPGHSIPSLKPYHHMFSAGPSVSGTPPVPAFVDVYHEAAVSHKSVSESPSVRKDAVSVSDDSLLILANNDKKRSLQSSKKLKRASIEAAKDSKRSSTEAANDSTSTQKSEGRRVSEDNHANDNVKDDSINEDDKKGKENVREGRPRRERAPSTAKKSRDVRTKCDVCQEEGNNSTLVRCDECARCFHFGCLNPPCKKSPKVHGWSWACSDCAPSDVDKSWHL